MQRSDEQLVAMVRSGDSSAYSELFERHHAGLYNFSHSLVRNSEDAKDIAQLAFIKVYEALPRLEKLNFSAYLYRTARNLAMDELKAKKRFDGPDALDKKEDPYLFADPQRTVLLSEQQKHVREAADRLTESYRTVLTLRELQELSYERIAEVMNTSKQAVGVTLARARMKFKQEYRMSQISARNIEAECKKMLPLLSAYIDNELDDEKKQKVKAHLKECPFCRLALEELTESSKTYRGIIPFIPPAALGDDLFKALKLDKNAAAHETTSGSLIGKTVSVPGTSKAASAALIILLGGIVLFGALLGPGLAGREASPARSSKVGNDRPEKLSISSENGKKTAISEISRSDADDAGEAPSALPPSPYGATDNTQNERSAPGASTAGEPAAAGSASGQPTATSGGAIETRDTRNRTASGQTPASNPQAPATTNNQDYVAPSTPNPAPVPAPVPEPEPEIVPDLTPPPTPTPMTPVSGEMLPGSFASITWAAVSDPGGVTYTLEIEKYDDGLGWVADVVQGGLTGVDYGYSMTGYEARWRVRAADGEGNASAFSPWNNFFNGGW